MNVPYRHNTQTGPNTMKLLIPRIAISESNLTHWSRSKNFPDDIFKGIFFNEIVRILIKISLKFVPQGPINNIPALFQIMTCRRPGDKPLSESMMVNLLTHKCVTRPQWVDIDGIGVVKMIYEYNVMWLL